VRSPDEAKRNPGTVSPADRLIAGCTVAISVVFQFPVWPETNMTASAADVRFREHL
jgi:hypothetical protein